MYGDSSYLHHPISPIYTGQTTGHSYSVQLDSDVHTAFGVSIASGYIKHRLWCFHLLKVSTSSNKEETFWRQPLSVVSEQYDRRRCFFYLLSHCWQQ